MRTITQEIADLRGMDTPALVERYEELFEKPPRCRNREHLWKRCAWKLQEQRLGGLSGAAKRRLDELIAELDLPLGERHGAVSGALNGHVRRSEHKPGTVFTRTSGDCTRRHRRRDRLAQPTGDSCASRGRETNHPLMRSLAVPHEHRGNLHRGHRRAICTRCTLRNRLRVP